MGYETVAAELAEWGIKVTERDFSKEFADRRRSITFNVGYRDFGDMIMGAVWGRSTLDVRTRRIISISIAAALNYQPILKAHFELALQRNDLSLEEIQEIILQIGQYAGLPSATCANQNLQECVKAVAEKKALQSEI